ncbi:unnamed protein product [Vicia faba]|uniref:Uncharacterized protein n=1 Tax=Vicia faba TaxID=3906 RepID=A0AAV0YXT1_VICFA|nr:unnamed protein product [Vicia faba]
MISNRMGVKRVTNHSKYLGLPVVLGRSKKEVFCLVMERIWKKTKGWKEGFLSNVGREVLIKVVAHAILSYIMSSFKLHVGVCLEIKQLMVRFWWGAKEGEIKVNWMSWDKLSDEKVIGGKGFGGIVDFNLNLIGKKYGAFKGRNVHCFVGFRRVSIFQIVRFMRPFWDMALVLHG